MQGEVQWHAGVAKGAATFMAAWHKEEARKSQGRATDRATKTKSGKDTTPRKGVGGGQQKRSETAREESKREEMDRVARHVAD